MTREAIEMTVQDLALEAYNCFERAIRQDDGDDIGYYRIKEGSPEWVTELVHAAHGGDFLPDDYRYKWAMEACEFIATHDDPEGDSAEFADQCVDVYTGARFAWLASNLQRAGYCDEALSNGMIDLKGGIVEIVGAGQYEEAGEVFGLVINFLQDNQERREES